MPLLLLSKQSFPEYFQNIVHLLRRNGDGCYDYLRFTVEESLFHQFFQLVDFLQVWIIVDNLLRVLIRYEETCYCKRI